MQERHAAKCGANTSEKKESPVVKNGAGFVSFCRLCVFLESANFRKRESTKSDGFKAVCVGEKVSDLGALWKQKESAYSVKA